MPMLIVHPRGPSGKSAFHAWVRRGDPQALSRALERGRLKDCQSWRDVNGWTGPMEAAFQGREACMGVLIEAGADLDAKDGWGWSAAMVAAVKGHGPRPARAILSCSKTPRSSFPRPRPRREPSVPHAFEMGSSQVPVEWSGGNGGRPER